MSISLWQRAKVIIFFKGMERVYFLSANRTLWVLFGFSCSSMDTHIVYKWPPGHSGYTTVLLVGGPLSIDAKYPIATSVGHLPMLI